jgi:hypothetical protein
MDFKISVTRIAVSLPSAIHFSRIGFRLEDFRGPLQILRLHKDPMACEGSNGISGIDGVRVLALNQVWNIVGLQKRDNKVGLEKALRVD